MTRYALLIQPSANRVYSSASTALTQSELQVFNQSVLDGRLGEVSAATIGIAWNTLVARREAAAAILAGAGLDPADSGPYLAFRHRVDQAIVRDILVARKP